MPRLCKLRRRFSGDPLCACRFSLTYNQVLSMPYQVLARKYRPQRFEDVIGQEHVTQTLKNAITQQRIAHGYIFSGHRGIGKTTVARILAMALNCRSKDHPLPEPCGVCDSCVEVREGRSVDVIEIDAATNRGIDEIRELRDAARYRPARDRYKIYILDEAHQITDAAFNALLKTLEEPPPHVIFMMATTQPEDIPQTIRSRCQHFSFHAVRFDRIVEQLRDIAKQEKIEIEAAALALIAEAGDGSLRDALSILDQAIASSGGKLKRETVQQLVGAVPGETLEQVMNAVASNSGDEVLRLIDRLLLEGESPVHFARQMVRFLRNCLVSKVAGPDSDLLQISEDERARAGRVSALFSEEDLTRFLQIMLRGYGDVSYKAEQRFHLELTLLKLVHARRLLPVEEILSGAEPRTIPKPSAAPPVTSRSTVSENPTPKLPSPFERDRSRKAGPELSTGTAAAEATASPASDVSESSIAQLREAVLTTLENAGHRMAASTLEGGHWQLNANELLVQTPASPSLIEMAMTAEAKRIASAAATSVAGSNIRLRVEGNGTGNGSTPTTTNPPRNATSGRQRAIEDPIVRRVQEKFDAEIRTVIDYREKQR